jgi:stearoyl-CoA 9-desaturase NADPH oxidoreductase
VRLTLPIREVVLATPRSAVVRVDLAGHAFEYRPGQAVVVGAHGGTEGRPYSLATAPGAAREADEIELLIGVDLRGSAGPHLPSLRPGALVDVNGPLGSFTLPESLDDSPLLFVAGGRGIAPLRSMLQHALAHLPDEVVGVAYSARSPEDFAYGDELRTLAGEGRIRLRKTVTRDAGERWDGYHGRLSPELLASLVPAGNTLCFVCGPEALVHDVPRMLVDLGVERSRIHLEEWAR